MKSKFIIRPYDGGPRFGASWQWLSKEEYEEGETAAKAAILDLMIKRYDYWVQKSTYAAPQLLNVETWVEDSPQETNQ